MKVSNNFSILFSLIIIIVFLIGCQQKVQEEITEPLEPIKIVEEETIDEELEKEFNDNLDDALRELEEIENI